MTNKNTAHVLIIISALAAVMSALDFFFKIDVLNLAGTQWMLVAIVFGIYALYSKTQIV